MAVGRPRCSGGYFRRKLDGKREGKVGTLTTTSRGSERWPEVVVGVKLEIVMFGEVASLLRWLELVEIFT